MIGRSVVAGSLRLLSLVASSGMLLAILAAPASGHQFEADSEVTIDASPRTGPPGTFVTFFGEVTSTEPSCEPDRVVHLTRTQPDPPTEVGSGTTNASGEWSATVQVFETSRYRATIDPNLEGVHPHRHVCHGDGSGSVRIRITPGPTPTPSPSPSPSPSPGGCVGTQGNDVLVGTIGPDNCHGRGGDDMIDSLAGDDSVRGGPGNDDIDCGPDQDRAWGNKGADSFANCEQVTP